MVEKNEYRCHGSQAVGVLVAQLPSEDYASFVKWLSGYSRHAKVAPPPSTPPTPSKVTPPPPLETVLEKKYRPAVVRVDH